MGREFKVLAEGLTLGGPEVKAHFVRTGCKTYESSRALKAGQEPRQCLVKGVDFPKSLALQVNYLVVNLYLNKVYPVQPLGAVSYVT